jgi:hypothetical protein
MWRIGASVRKRDGPSKVANPATIIAAVPSVGINAAVPGNKVSSLNRKVENRIIPSPALDRVTVAQRGIHLRRETGTRASNPPSANSQTRVSVEK